MCMCSWCYRAANTWISIKEEACGLPASCFLLPTSYFLCSLSCSYLQAFLTFCVYLYVSQGAKATANWHGSRERVSKLELAQCADMSAHLRVLRSDWPSAVFLQEYCLTAYTRSATLLSLSVFDPMNRRHLLIPCISWLQIKDDVSFLNRSI